MALGTIGALIAQNPGTALSIGSILAKLGQGYFAGKDQRSANQQNKDAIARANTISAFGGRAMPELVEPTAGRATTILGGLGTALGTASSLYGLHDANKLRNLQMAGAKRDANINRGIDAALTAGNQVKSNITTSGGGGEFIGAGPGGTPEAPLLNIPATEVVANRFETGAPPGYNLGMFRGQQLLSEAEREERAALLPFLEYQQKNEQLASMVNAVESTPSLFKDLPAATRARLVPHLSSNAIEQATGRRLSEKGIEQLNAADAVNQRIGRLQQLFQEAVSRGLTGPISSVELFDSSLGFFQSPEERGAEFKDTGDDALLKLFDVTTKGLIPTVRRAQNETGVMTAADEERIRSLFPVVSALKSTAELAKLPELMRTIDGLMGRHFQALEGQNFINTGINNFGATESEIMQEYRRRQRNR